MWLDTEPEWDVCPQCGNTVAALELEMSTDGICPNCQRDVETSSGFGRNPFDWDESWGEIDWDALLFSRKPL
jgi:hypothetical protein